MKKRLFIFLFAVISIFPIAMVHGCMSFNGLVNLTIRDLRADVSVLKKLCTADSCLSTSGSSKSIVLRSHFDQRVQVNISEPTGNEQTISINIRLPYALNKHGAPIPTEIKPETYNWKGSAKTDLMFLKEAGVLSMTDAEIKTIADLAEPGIIIHYCQGKWNQTRSNCQCRPDKTDVACYRCGGGGSSEQFSLPKQRIQKK